MKFELMKLRIASHMSLWFFMVSYLVYQIALRKKEKRIMHQTVTTQEMAVLFEKSINQREDGIMSKMNNTLEEIILTTETLMSAVQDITDIVDE